VSTILAHFIDAQHDGQPIGEFGAYRIDGKIAVEHLLEQEQECGKGLILRTGGDMAIDGQVGQERIDFRVSHFVRVPPLAIPVTIEPEKPFDPLDIGFFAANGHMEQAHFRAHLIQQLRFATIGGGQIRLRSLGHYPDFQNKIRYRILNITDNVLEATGQL